MAHLADVPEQYRQFFFLNAGGPSRKILSRDVVEKKWQLVTLECSHRILMPKYQKAAKVGCGFCGGFGPVSLNRRVPRAPRAGPGGLQRPPRRQRGREVGQP